MTKIAMTVLNALKRLMCLKGIHAHDGLDDCFWEMGALTLPIWEVNDAFTRLRA